MSDTTAEDVLDVTPAAEHDATNPSTTRDRGASLVEYALLVALIAMVCIGAVSFLGTSTSDNYSRSTSSMFSG